MSRRNPRDRRVKMLRLWLRALRKMSRREEDAKKRTERIKKREAAARAADVMERFWESWDTWQGGTIL